MIKRKVGNQIENLITDNKSLQSKGQMIYDIEHAIHYWKDFFEGYKILSLHALKRLDLRNIWVKTHYKGGQKCCHIVLFYNGVHV